MIKVLIQLIMFFTNSHVCLWQECPLLDRNTKYQILLKYHAADPWLTYEQIENNIYKHSYVYLPEQVPTDNVYTNFY